MSRFNCKVRPIIFAVTSNAINKELVLRFPSKKEVCINKKTLNFYLENYDCFKEEKLLIGQVWFFKSKKTENG